MIGASRAEFVAHLEHYLRQNGRMSSEEFAKQTGELPTIVDLVRSGDIDPTSSILKTIGWVAFDHSYYARTLVTEKRFMPIESATIKE